MLTGEEIDKVMSAVEFQAQQLGLQLGIAYFDAESGCSFTRAMSCAPSASDLQAFKKVKRAVYAGGDDEAYVIHRAGAIVAAIAVAGSGEIEAHHDCILAGVRALPASWQF